MMEEAELAAHSNAWVSRVCADLTVRLLNSHVVVVFSFCNVKLLFRCCWHLWMRSQRGSSWSPTCSRGDGAWIDGTRRGATASCNRSSGTSEERRHHGFTHLAINLGATSAFELVGENTDMSHDHKSSQAHPSSNATAASWRQRKTQPMITVLVAIWSVWGVSTNAINKKVLCVRLWKGTCFCRRVRSSFPFPFPFLSSSVTQSCALQLDFLLKKRCLGRARGAGRG